MLEKYEVEVPKTWEELTGVAKQIQAAERDAGNKDMWGFVWQGKAYEGLTCNALEWVKSYGGGQIVEADGSISINSPEAVAALNTAKGWVGSISPEGVLSCAKKKHAASGRPAMPCSCATGRMPIPWVILMTVRSG
ncbi:MAG: hypothetical protein R3E95_22770 [Thiolinea sp.]